jgi:co-chaperonin GroES (HSP10)
MDTITPVGARVLILPYESASKSAAGLVMENNSNTSNAPVRGTVIAAGDKSQFKKGQQLMFVRYSSYKCVIITPEGEKEYLLIEDEDVLALVNPAVTKTKK